MAATFLGALPIGMLGLGVLLWVQSMTGSLAAAGVVSGSFSIGNAAGLVTQGGLIDRHGQTRVLIAGALMCPAALVGLIVAGTLDAPLGVHAMLACGAGAALPATTSSMRILWPQLVTDPVLRSAAYTVLATQFQIAMVAGPLLVSALVVVGSAAVSVLVAAGFACGGGLLFAVAPASRRSASSDGSTVVPRRWLGAGIWTLLLAGFGGGVAVGMLTVTVPAVAAAQRSAALSGLLFAALSVGELLGGLVYGGVAWRLPTALRLVVGQGAAALSMAALALVTETPAGMLAVIFAAGACLAPTAIASSALLDDIAPAGSLARAYTVMVAVGLLGVAAGSSAGGNLATSLGPRPVLLTASGLLAVVASWTTIRSQSLIDTTASSRSPG